MKTEIHITCICKKIMVLIFCIPFFFVVSLKAIAEWSIVTYIQADNNLDSFAYHNINSMKKAPTSRKVNVLIQWDQPNNNKTWRYKIEKGKKIDAGSLRKEMGRNPEKELVDMMRWVKDKYPAKHYMMVLWNHGNGVIDRNRNRWKTILSWVEIPGALVQGAYTDNQGINDDDRGILYDDSQGTFLTNQALSRALNKIHHEVLGKKLSIIGMDACLMAMLEVAYQVKDDALYFVGAEHTEPGDGWAYDRFLKSLIASPERYDPCKLAQEIVYAYGRYYKSDPERTQSAINLSNLDTIKNGVDRVVKSIKILKKIYNKNKTCVITNHAKKNVTRFYTSAYADLHSFYYYLRKKTRKVRRKSGSRFSLTLRTFESLLTKEMRNIRRAVVANTTGRDFKRAKGIAIYLPRWNINATYYATNFAKESSWLSFISQ